jgi:hypothetical protein
LLEIAQLMSTVVAAPEVSIAEVLSQHFHFSTTAKNIIDRIIVGERFNHREPYIECYDELYLEPNFHIYRNGEETPVEIDNWNELQEQVIGLLCELMELNVSQNRALLIVQVMLCDRSNYYVSEDTICDYFELFGHTRRSVRSEPTPYIEKPITFVVAAHNSECTDDCPICMCEPTDEVFRCNTCKHEVCKDWMDHWLSSHIEIHGLVEGDEHNTYVEALHHTCPYCNTDLR